jgi:hypothetical protein
MACPSVRVLVATLMLSVSVTGRGAALNQDRVWFCPGPGTIDYVRLFERPAEWAHARQLVSVFKFYQQHTQTPAPSIVGPNTYDSLARAGVFRTLKTWGKKIAIEVGAVKEGFCTPDASGMNAAIAGSVASVRAIESAGGAVTYLALDEPFLSGQLQVCGGPGLEPTADRLAIYGAGVGQALPNVRVGLIEAYPSFNPDAFVSMLQLLTARGVKPAFLHVDIDIKALRPGRDDFARDMTRLATTCREQRIPFGLIIWGYNGDNDVLYSLDAERLAGAIADTFRWDEMPEHLIFQSWAESATGLRITPSNLPEDRLYSHTQLLWSTLRRLNGQTAASTGTAISRR